MKPWFRLPAGRAREATATQLAASGAASSYGYDPIDGERGWRPIGQQGPREVPYWTIEKARTHSVHAYRTNPMAKAIVDTYTSFCVGDSGVAPQVTNPEVLKVVDEFWNDPRNDLTAMQELLLRSNMLMGESVLELMVGGQSGVVRYCPIEPLRVTAVKLWHGNPLWPEALELGGTGEGDGRRLTVAQVDDLTGLRDGEAMFWPSFKALDTDVRGTPFLMSVLDQLEAYDAVLSNLIDRTALARYLVWDVTVQGGQAEVDEFVAARGGLQVPPSGSIEVHNDTVTWEQKSVQTGAIEDSVAARQVLTQVAAGAGLAKTWLADPEDANRATSLTMAEPVRRRVGGIQKTWLSRQTDLARYSVDRAVAAHRLPRTVEATDPRTGQTFQVPASRAVTVTGPEIAAADAQIQAQVLLNLSTGLEKFVAAGVMTREAAKVAARKAWEAYVGVPYTAELDKPDADPDDIATAIDDAETARRKGKKPPVKPAPEPGDEDDDAAEANFDGNPAALHRYWTNGKGLAKWKTASHPWTTLYGHLLKHMDGDKDLAARTTSAWYHDVFGHWPGETGNAPSKKAS